VEDLLNWGYTNLSGLHRRHDTSCGVASTLQSSKQDLWPACFRKMQRHWLYLLNILIFEFANRIYGRRQGRIIFLILQVVCWIGLFTRKCGKMPRLIRRSETRRRAEGTAKKAAQNATGVII